MMRESLTKLQWSIGWSDPVQLWTIKPCMNRWCGNHKPLFSNYWQDRIPFSLLSVVTRIKLDLWTGVAEKINTDWCWIRRNIPAYTTTLSEEKHLHLPFIQVLHLAYSPDFAPSDYHLFYSIDQFFWNKKSFTFKLDTHVRFSVIKKTQYWSIDNYNHPSNVPEELFHLQWKIITLWR